MRYMFSYFVDPFCTDIEETCRRGNVVTDYHYIERHGKVTEIWNNVNITPGNN